MAYNIALKRRQNERGTTTLDDARAALNLVDDAPDPERVVEARSELAALERALVELAPRRREILIASRAHGIPLREIAAQLGVSQRLVEMELKLALTIAAGTSAERSFSVSVRGRTRDQIIKRRKRRLRRNENEDPR